MAVLAARPGAHPRIVEARLVACLGSANTNCTPTVGLVRVPHRLERGGERPGHRVVGKRDVDVHDEVGGIGVDAPLEPGQPPVPLGPAVEHLGTGGGAQAGGHHQHLGVARAGVVVGVGGVRWPLADRGVEQRVVPRRVGDRPGVDADLAAGLQPVLALPQLDHPVLAAVVEEDRLAVDDGRDQRGRPS